ncbi:MAG TPA: hypothetical protein ENK44_10800 [Caldithrix abyssi]|uniref:Uncharacterized protein n=1 Tax=Caldithrix abyssi TaxID=187145 RepID=A0A7V4U1I4_CALAY|nr:hypothetical protein [Caldithrix abyssi]
MFRLKSGVRIVLEFNNELSGVHLGVFVDQSAYRSSADTLLIMDAIAQRIQQILAESVPHTVLYPPVSFLNHPYNWREHKFIYSSLSSDRFSQEGEHIVRLFSDLNRNISFPYNTVTVPLPEAFYQKKYIKQQTVSFSRWQIKNFMENENPSRYFTVWLYGNYDPSQVVRLLENEIDHTVEKKSAAMPSSTKKISIYARKDTDGFTVFLPATTLIRHIALEFISDFLYGNITGKNPGSELDVRLPWGLNQQVYTVKASADPDWELLMTQLDKSKPVELQNWYANVYSKKIQLIASDPEFYLFYKTVALRYLSDSGSLTELWLPNSFPYRKIMEEIRQIAKAVIKAEKER